MKRNGAAFILYDAGTTEEQARDSFRRTYGREPEMVIIQQAATQAGPVTRAEAIRRTAGLPSLHRERSTIDRREPPHD